MYSFTGKLKLIPKAQCDYLCITGNFQDAVHDLKKQNLHCLKWSKGWSVGSLCLLVAGNGLKWSTHTQCLLHSKHSTHVCRIEWKCLVSVWFYPLGTCGVFSLPVSMTTSYLICSGPAGSLPLHLSAQHLFLAWFSKFWTWIFRCQWHLVNYALFCETMVHLGNNQFLQYLEDVTNILF